MRPWLKKLWGSRAGRPQAAQSVRRHGPPLAVEQLEDRAVPASYTASTVPELIAAIEQANATSVEDTITLAPSQTFTLTKAISGVAANTSLIIVGNGDIIERSKQTHSAFRLFDVAAGASLTLTNLTLRGALRISEAPSTTSAPSHWIVSPCRTTSPTGSGAPSTMPAASH